MRWSDVNLDPSRKALREFGAAGFVVLGVPALWRVLGRGDGRSAALLGSAAVALGVIALVRPGLLRPVYRVATVAAFPVGWVVSWLALGIVYYGVFTPLAVFFRVTGRDPLARRSGGTGATTYWAAKPVPDDPARYLRQY